MKTHLQFTHATIVPPPRNFSSVEIGACLEFSGIVRELENGKKVPGLHYEAYEAMAKTELEKIFRELALKHPCEEIFFIHRLGLVPVGESSMFIRVSSRHRQAALALMAELIDRLKKNAPIWKNSQTV